MWHKIQFTLDKNDISIKIIHGDKTDDYCGHWTVPSGIVYFNYSGTREEKGINIPMPIIVEYGSIGFRNDGHESAYIKNVLIEKM